MEPDRLKTTLTFKRIATSALTFAVILEQTIPALATIDNTATSSGTYNAGTTTSTGSTVNVPVTAAAPALSVVKSVTGAPTVAAGSDATISDSGDTITFSYAIQNTGNVTLTSVSPTDAGPQFNGTAGTGTMAAFVPASVGSLAPGATANFTAIYTMSQLDVLRAAGLTNGVTNVAAATGTTPSLGTFNSGNSPLAQTTIPAGPQLAVVKSVTAGPSGGTADVGETITYRYRVTNSGNVVMTNVAINDTHEGTLLPAGTAAGETFVSDGPLGAVPATTDNNATAGIWGTLQPGAVIDFFYVHTVTQTEVNNG
jgi:uncharacterized repeat protein (TIGR01451 family)